jgi:exonuclease III
LVIVSTLAHFAKFTLVNLYGPNSDSPGFYDTILGVIEDFGNESVIICGDWNLVLDPQEDAAFYKQNNNPRAGEAVLSYIEEKELVDVWRMYHEDANQYTWHKNASSKNVKIRLFI